MPILNIEVIGDREHFPQDLAQRFADAAGSSLNSRPGGTWVKVHFLEEAAYAESGGATEGLPIIVSLIQAEVPRGDVLRDQVAGLARALAQAADHPVENVHIIIEPAAKGRIAFGGTLIE